MPTITNVLFVGFIALCWNTSVLALNPQELLQDYALEAKKSPNQFSAAAGKTFYLTERKNVRGDVSSCSHCHTKNPMQTGKTKKGKSVAPLAAGTNKQRFTNKTKVEEWFKRDCKEVYDRECTAQEKGDFVAYMISVK